MISPFCFVELLRIKYHDFGIIHAPEACAAPRCSLSPNKRRGVDGLKILLQSISIRVFVITYYSFKKRATIITTMPPRKTSYVHPGNQL